MTALQQFRQELDVFLEQTISEQGQLRIFIAFAEEEIERFRAAWAESSGGKAIVDVVVGGQAGAPISSARLSDPVLARARTLGLAVDRALTLYDTLTKVVTGGYKADLAVFAASMKVSPEAVLRVSPGTEV